MRFRKKKPDEEPTPIADEIEDHLKRRTELERAQEAGVKVIFVDTSQEGWAEAVCDLIEAATEEE